MKSNNSINCLYLFADGHAKVIVSTRHPIYGNLEHVEIYEKLCDVASLPQSGRIVIHNTGLFSVLKRCNYVQVWPENGSDETRAKGIHIASLAIHNESGYFAIHDVEGISTGGFTLQLYEYGEKFDASLRNWANKPVAKVHRAKAGKAVYVS